MAPHKNASRAPLRPLNLPTLALTVGGLGFLRPAPGTWGSIPPVLIALVMSLAGAAPVAVSLVLAIILFAASLACILWGYYAETRFGRKDAAEVVADEAAAVCLPALVAASADGSATENAVALALALVLFRVFDIAKPWPAGRLERLPHGWGVLLDDLMAGLYAALVLLIALLLWNA